MDCSLSTIRNSTGGFHFERLYALNLYLVRTCPRDSDVFFTNTKMLTEAVCRKVTGTSDSIWNGWTRYPIADIWTRIVTWKLPLLQLVAQFPRAPLGLHIEAAALAHLLGDPIDSMMSMMVALSACHSRVKLSKDTLSDFVISKTTATDYRRIWKSLAMIMVSYDEWGKPEKAEEVVALYNNLGQNINTMVEFRKLYEDTAFALAADRSSMTLPVVFAEGIFIGGWLIALLKAAASEPSPTNWVNVEAQSIAISAIYLWVTATVVVGSIIGASQSEASVPRILRGFEAKVTALRVAHSIEFSDGIEYADMNPIQRAVHGGIFSWKPFKWQKPKKKSDRSEYHTRVLIAYAIISITMVAYSYVTGVMLSYFAAPRGPSCRHIPESLMFGIWLVSFGIEYILERWGPKQEECFFWAVFAKDTFFALGNIVIVLVVQWGIMNRCSCWSTWGMNGLHLPQLAEVKPDLMYFIRHTAPWIIFSAILFQLLFCVALAWKYWDAMKVFMHADDGEYESASRRKRANSVFALRD